VKLKNPERNAYHFVMFTKGYRKMAGLFSLLTAGECFFIHSSPSWKRGDLIDRQEKKKETEKSCSATMKNNQREDYHEN